MCISEAGTIHRWFSGAYLMRFSGHILLSLLPTSGWLNRSLISWLLFCAVWFLWFFAYFLMTSVTYGMPKSLCKVMFEMYQRALASFLYVLPYSTEAMFNFLVIFSIHCERYMGKIMMLCDERINKAETWHEMQKNVGHCQWLKVGSEPNCLIFLGVIALVSDYYGGRMFQKSGRNYD
jgi:hypothetical protein